MKTKTNTKNKQSAKPPKKAQRKPQTQGRLSRTRGSAASDAKIANTSTPPNAQRRTSKKSSIEALVRRDEGAAIDELMAATGWQEHSVRAALTGLRKAGHAITRERVTNQTHK